jgi:hypothetical protein
MFKEVQDSEDMDGAQEKVPHGLDSKPDVILEHGKTRLTLDLDGCEWFWLFLAIVFVASLLTWLGVLGT